MIWYFVALIGLVVVLGALWWWGREDDAFPIVPSGRDVHKARAWGQLGDSGTGSGDAGPT